MTVKASSYGGGYDWTVKEEEIWILTDGNDEAQDKMTKLEEKKFKHWLENQM